MEQFILIFRHEDGVKVASPEQIQEWMKQTMDWIGSIAAQNKYVAGNGLPFEDARVVTKRTRKWLSRTAHSGILKKQLPATLLSGLARRMKQWSSPKDVLCYKAKETAWKSAK
jgi:hypothetical protein